MAAAAPDSERTVFEPAAVEREQMEVIAQAAAGVIRAEHPRLDVGLQAGKLQRRPGGREKFLGIERLDRGGDLGEIEFGGAKLAR